MRDELAIMIGGRERSSKICSKQCRDNGSGHFSCPGCPIPSVMGGRSGQSFHKTRRKPTNFLSGQEKEALKPQNEAYMDKSKVFPYYATQGRKEELSRSLRRQKEESKRKEREEEKKEEIRRLNEGDREE
jgi:hypothetical protein